MIEANGEKENLKFKKKFYCPYCGEKVVFLLLHDMDDETFDCPGCQGIMLLEGE